ncbi:Parvulin-like peptidyl-prolyl isomerase [Halopseudomonas litoralis]|uniref:Parvulin-like peptidyl-prolyl isomerase n=1 Tax=Halopseudomonas litoralis TaxID=797277 RepID=A0A1H1Q814_9GAMM|nr:peptidylprolyl isomerase [Halopseudomonas litoralis]SDS19417.1 Parvulin-like peptidyl-prolyl isomerase [Halopseudomonas litoralis]
MKTRNMILALVAVGVVVAIYMMDGSSSSADAVTHEVKSTQTKGGSGASDSSPVASLGSVSIEPEAVNDWLATLPAGMRSALQQNRDPLDQWLRNQLTEKALFAEAQAQEWSERPEIARAIELATREIVLRSYLDSVSQPAEDYPAAADMAAAYEQNKDQLVIPARYRVRQIYLAAPANDEAAVAAASQQANALVKQAKAKDADFAELARAHSHDMRSAALGGEIGFLPLAQLVPEVRPVVAGMKQGEVSEPVQTATGLHILMLEAVEEARNASLEEVDAQLRQALRQQRQAQVAQAYVEGVLSSSTLSIDGGQLTQLLE